jgi:5,10-methylenetetrahydromethanopterin reductase
LLRARLEPGPQLGLGFGGTRALAHDGLLARRAEELGFAVVSVFADLGDPPPLPALLAMAGSTSRVRLGPACLNPFTLHPVEIAGQIAALDEATRGRAFLGLATGAWLDAVGIEAERPLRTVREAVSVVSKLLAGDDTGFAGERFALARGFRLSSAPRPVPLLVGSWGERLGELAGEVAAELKVAPSANPDLVPVLLERVARGAARAGRDPGEVGIVLGGATVVDEDGAAARAAVRAALAGYLAEIAELDPTVDLDPELVAALRARVGAGDRAGAGRLVPDAILDRFAYAGTPMQIVEQAARLFDAGVTRIEFSSPHGLDPRRGIDLLGTRVLPELVS